MIYKNRNKHFGIRMNEETHGKLHYIAAYEGRTMNHQILSLLNRNIREFEQKHGPIPTEKEKEED